MISALHGRSNSAHSMGFRPDAQIYASPQSDVRSAEAAAITQLEYLILALSSAKDTITARSLFPSLVEVLSTSSSAAVAKSVCTAIASCVELLGGSYKYFSLATELFTTTAVRSFGEQLLKNE